MTLREELEAIDEYLDIESIRFGPKLRIEKDIARDTLDIVVPSMILQPLVENAIKHGLSRKVGPGHITLRSRRDGERLIIEIEDDGLGISDQRLAGVMDHGIGLSNVNERLRTIYGAGCQLRLKSIPGEGTWASVEIPEIAIPERVTA